MVLLLLPTMVDPSMLWHPRIVLLRGPLLLLRALNGSVTLAALSLRSRVGLMIVSFSQSRQPNVLVNMAPLPTHVPAIALVVFTGPYSFVAPPLHYKAPTTLSLS